MRKWLNHRRVIAQTQVQTLLEYHRTEAHWRTTTDIDSLIARGVEEHHLAGDVRVELACEVRSLRGWWNSLACKDGRER